MLVPKRRYDVAYGVALAWILTAFSRATAARASSPDTSQQTTPADSSGSVGVISRTFGIPARPAFRAEASARVRSVTRSGPIVRWNSKASASAQRFSKLWYPPGVAAGPGGAPGWLASPVKVGIVPPT